MAVTSTLVGNFLLKLINGTNIDLSSSGNTIKVMLLTASHTTDIDTQEFIDDVSANEVSGTGYTAGGYTLLSKTATYDSTDNEAAADAADPTWTITSSLSPAYAAYYKDTGTPSTSPIIGIVNFGQTYTIANGTLTLTHNAEGYVNLTIV